MLVSASLSQIDATFVRDLVRRRSAIHLDESKHYLLETRLGQLARETGLTTVNELVQKARSAVEGWETKIVEAITTHETSFLRDARPFEVLRQEVLPAFLASRKRTRSLTIWSAACSTGQEPYSIAMTVLEHFPELEGWPLRIVATDLSEQVLAKAREGRYRQLEVNRGLPAHFLLRHFERVGADYRVSERVRKLVEFRKLNLLDGWGSLRPDIVFMRNVLIYFEQQTKQTILQRARQVSAPDAVLFLGAAESTFGIDEGWVRASSQQQSSYFRKRP
jgi:chemotaxis protein methyltransferase CheR